MIKGISNSKPDFDIPFNYRLFLSPFCAASFWFLLSLIGCSKTSIVLFEKFLDCLNSLHNASSLFWNCSSFIFLNCFPLMALLYHGKTIMWNTYNKCNPILLKYKKRGGNNMVQNRNATLKSPYLPVAYSKASSQFSRSKYLLTTPSVFRDPLVMFSIT